MLLGQSQYEVLRKAAIYTAKGFEKSGMEVTIVDSTSEDFDASILYGTQYDLIFMNQAFIYGLKLDNGKDLLYMIKSRVCGWIFDDVLFHYNRVLANKYSHTSLLSIDGEADRIMRIMQPGLNPINTVLHGGFLAKEPNQKKTIDILCPCTLGKKPAWKNEPTAFEKELACVALNRWNENPEMSARKAVETVINALGEKLDRGALLGLTNVVMYVMDSIRYTCRKKILEELVKTDLKVHLVGRQDQDEQYPSNVTVHGPMEIDSVVDLFAKSKIVINPFPCVYEEGAHERIFTALLNKAVCFTPGYPFLRELLSDRVEYIDLKNMEAFSTRVKSVLSNSESIGEKLEDNFKYAFENHTWEKRGEEIIELLTKM